jgi:hypothetical protein
MHRKFYRFGGWSARSLRSMAKRPIPMADKLVDLYTRIKGSRGVFARWQADSDDYLRVLEERAERVEMRE